MPPSFPPFPGEESPGVATETVAPPQNLQREREERRAEASLDSLIFLFQLLMAFAITNAAYLFFTNGGVSYDLRPWISYTPMDVAVFFAFATFVIPFVHADVLLLKESYQDGFANKGLWPLVDFFLLFMHAALFYALSHTFATLTTQPFNFFIIVGAILLLNVFWSLLSAMIDFRNRKVTITYVIINMLTVVAGGYVVWDGLPHTQELLLAALVLRNVADFAITYNFLFPSAFSSSSARHNRRVADRAGDPLEA